jgi:hypothetical protein
MSTCSGIVYVNDATASGIVVRLYRRSDGGLVDETTTISGGLFEMESSYEGEDHYVVALYTTSGTNALIYDWLGA